MEDLDLAFEFDFYKVAVIFFAMLAAMTLYVLYYNFVKPFLRRRRYIKTEMLRSHGRNEYRYWRSQLKMLYISRFPIIGRIIAKFIR